MDNQTQRQSQQFIGFNPDEIIKEDVQDDLLLKQQEIEEIREEKQSMEKDIKEEEKEIDKPSLAKKDSPAIYDNQLLYSKVKISYPVVKEQAFNNYMIYKVNFLWKDKELYVMRRFNDFIKLREAMRNALPCHFIPPAHRKKVMVN